MTVSHLKSPGHFSVYCGSQDGLYLFSYNQFFSINHFTNPLMTVPSAHITISINATFMSRYLSLFFSFLLTQWTARTVQSTIWQVLSLSLSLYLSLCWLSLGLVVWLRLCDLFVFQNLRKVCADSGAFICHLLLWPNKNF